MSIVIIDENSNKLEPFRNMGFRTVCTKIQELEISNFDLPIYLVSPSNSFLFMDTGISSAYLEMFPEIEDKINEKLLQEIWPMTKEGDVFVPIGCSITIEILPNLFLICSPTTLYPQNVSNTNNAYYAMKSTLKEWEYKGTLICPPFATGQGQMPSEKSSDQMFKAITEYPDDEWDGMEFQHTIMGEQPKILINSVFQK